MLEYPKCTSLDLHVAHQIKKRRQTLGITQRILAECLGVTFQQIQKYENGHNRISAARLYQIAKYLNTNVAYFFHGFSEDDTDATSLKEDHMVYIPSNEKKDTIHKDLKSLETSYQKIKDPKLRKKVLQLVKQIAQ